MQLAPEGGRIARYQAYDFSGLNLGDRGASAVVEALKLDQAFASVSFASNGLRDVGVQAICELLARHPTAMRVDLSANPLSRSAGLAILRMLLQNAGIVEVGLAGTKLDPGLQAQIETNVDENKKIVSARATKGRLGQAVRGALMSQSAPGQSVRAAVPASFGSNSTMARAAASASLGLSSRPYPVPPAPQPPTKPPAPPNAFLPAVPGPAPRPRTRGQESGDAAAAGVLGRPLSRGALPSNRSFDAAGEPSSSVSPGGSRLFRGHGAARNASNSTPRERAAALARGEAAAPDARPNRGAGPSQGPPQQQQQQRAWPDAAPWEPKTELPPIAGHGTGGEQPTPFSTGSASRPATEARRRRRSPALKQPPRPSPLPSRPPHRSPLCLRHPLRSPLRIRRPQRTPPDMGRPHLSPRNMQHPIHSPFPRQPPLRSPPRMWHLLNSRPLVPLPFRSPPPTPRPPNSPPRTRPPPGSRLHREHQRRSLPRRQPQNSPLFGPRWSPPPRSGHTTRRQRLPARRLLQSPRSPRKLPPLRSRHRHRRRLFPRVDPARGPRKALWSHLRRRPRARLEGATYPPARRAGRRGGPGAGRRRGGGAGAGRGGARGSSQATPRGLSAEEIMAEARRRAQEKVAQYLAQHRAQFPHAAAHAAAAASLGGPPTPPPPPPSRPARKRRSCSRCRTLPGGPPRRPSLRRPPLPWALPPGCRRRPARAGRRAGPRERREWALEEARKRAEDQVAAFLAKQARPAPPRPAPPAPPRSGPLLTPPQKLASAVAPQPASAPAPAPAPAGAAAAPGAHPYGNGTAHQSAPAAPGPVAAFPEPQFEGNLQRRMSVSSWISDATPSVFSEATPRQPRHGLSHSMSEDLGAGSERSFGTLSSVGGRRDVFNRIRHRKYHEVEALLDAGTPLEARDKRGNTPLIVAVQNNNKRIAKLLLRRGANINAQNFQGNTALHHAFAFSYQELAQYLISKGADDTIVNAAGQDCYASAKAGSILPSASSASLAAGHAQSHPTLPPSDPGPGGPQMARGGASMPNLSAAAAQQLFPADPASHYSAGAPPYPGAPYMQYPYGVQQTQQGLPGGYPGMNGFGTGYPQAGAGYPQAYPQATGYAAAGYMPGYPGTLAPGGPSVLMQAVPGARPGAAGAVAIDVPAPGQIRIKPAARGVSLRPVPE
eukprot:tig00001336_g8226.t1